MNTIVIKQNVTRNMFGPQVADGWTPLLAVVEDGERRVFQITDWIGGTGDKPPVGMYLGEHGLVPTPAEATDIGVPTDYSSRDALASARVPPSVQYVRTAGYHEAGDGGGALYKRVAIEPGHGGKVQSADGAWWELAEIIPTVLQLGCRPDYDPATGTGTDNAPIINAAFTKWKVILGTPGRFLIGDTITVPAHCALVGPQRITSVAGDPQAWSDPAAFVLVPRGLARVHVVQKMITECELSGGVIANPSAAEPYTASSEGRLDTYRLWDSTNQDADGITPATPKMFSIAVKMHRGSMLLNTAIRTSRFTGSLDYATSGATQIGDDQVDFGVYGESPYFARIAGCHVSWAFRVAAVAQVIDIDTDGSGFVPQGDRFMVEDCYLEGHTQFMSRGYDLCRVLSATSTSVTIAWFRSHRFPAQGTVRIDGTDYAYSGLSYAAGPPATLTFTGMSNVPGSVGDGSELCRGEDSADDFGTGGTTIKGSFLRHMTTPGLRPSTDSHYSDRFDYSGKGVEISGAQCRGYHISGTYMHSRDDVSLFVNTASDVYFVDSYHEAKYNTAGDPCARFIALSEEGKAARSVPYPVGSASDIHFVGWSQSESHTDMRPTYRTSSSFGRFGTASDILSGLFEPYKCSNDIGYDYGNQADGNARTIRMPMVRGDRHPLRITNRFGFTRASFDADGRMAVGSTHDTETPLPYQFCVYTGSGGRSAIITNTAGTTGLHVQNNGGHAQFLVEPDGRASLGNNNVRRVEYAFGYFRPAQDDTASLGQAASRWTQVYAATGAINTSDEREKADIGDIPDEWLDAWGDVEWGRYKWQAAIADKGDGARWHVGLIAQRVRDAFTGRGIDPFAIGLLCYDSWNKADGIKAGDRYGLRYEEALAMEAAWQRRRADRIEARLDALEAKSG